MHRMQGKIVGTINIITRSTYKKYINVTLINDQKIEAYRNL